MVTAPFLLLFGDIMTRDGQRVTDVKLQQAAGLVNHITLLVCSSTAGNSKSNLNRAQDKVLY